VLQRAVFSPEKGALLSLILRMVRNLQKDLNYKTERNEAAFLDTDKIG
jgi:hypothetical protein